MINTGDQNEKPVAFVFYELKKIKRAEKLNEIILTFSQRNEVNQLCGERNLTTELLKWWNIRLLVLLA